MRREQFAEAILRVVAGRERAAAIVGDFSEEGEGRSSAWFWWNVARTAARLSLRPIFAFLAAFGIGIELSRLWNYRTLVRGLTQIDRQVALLIFITSLCAVWSLVRYSWNDVAARFLTVLAASGTVWLAFRRAPAITIVIVAAVVLFMCHRREQTGGETKIIVTSILLAYAGYWAFRTAVPAVRLTGSLSRVHFHAILVRRLLIAQSLWFGAIVLISVLACSISRRIFSGDRPQKMIA